MYMYHISITLLLNVQWIWRMVQENISVDKFHPSWFSLSLKSDPAFCWSYRSFLIRKWFLMRHFLQVELLLFLLFGTISYSFDTLKHLSRRGEEMETCQDNPCKNGGNCNPLTSSRPESDLSYVCHCMTGFYGKTCEKGRLLRHYYFPPPPHVFNIWKENNSFNFQGFFCIKFANCTRCTFSIRKEKLAKG